MTVVKYVKIVLIMIGLIVVFLYGLYSLNTHSYHNKMNKIATVCITQSEEIEGLNGINLKICDSTYVYQIQEIKDTIIKNLGISDQKNPCFISIIYLYNDKQKEFFLEDSVCLGCSGVNEFFLKKDEIAFKYHP